MSVSESCARSRADLLGITLRHPSLDPIIPSTPRKVLPGFDFEEQISGVEVTVRAPERNVWAITRIGQNYELQELAGG